MKSKVKVGVVIPVLSEYQMAIQALESIRTKYDWEPCIIDNWRENKGVTWAWNKGVELCLQRGCTHILILNDDVVVAPLSIDKLIENWPDKYILLGMTHHNDISNQPEDKTYDESPDFSGFMITPETWRIIGPFDPGFFNWFGDNDTHRRINLAGFKAGRYHDAIYHHFKSIATQSLPDEQRTAWFNADHEYYLKKHGGEPGHETSV